METIQEFNYDNFIYNAVNISQMFQYVMNSNEIWEDTPIEHKKKKKRYLITKDTKFEKYEYEE